MIPAISSLAVSRNLLLSLVLLTLSSVPAHAVQASSCVRRDDQPGEHGFGMYFDSAAFAGVMEREWNPEWGPLVAELAEREEVRPRSIARFARCGPRLSDRERLDARLAAAAEQALRQNSGRLPPEEGPLQTVVRIQVGTDGRAIDVGILESSGFVVWDQVASRVAVQMAYQPGTLEGILIPMWFELPFRMKRNGGSSPAPPPDPAFRSR